jgi:hypothetical protein
MDSSLDLIVANIVANGRVTSEETMQMRRLVYSGPIIHRAAAEKVFAANDAARKSCPQWTDFFVETITTFLVEQTPPHGYVDQGNARWLIDHLGKGGQLKTRAELLLLVAVLEKAQNVADSLKEFTIAQIEQTVLTGIGATRSGSTARPGQIDDAEVALLRRALFGPASDSATMISEREARMLFRIKDATMAGDNAPEWQTLFVQLVGNYLMAHPTSRHMSREQALRLDAFMNDTIPNVGKFLSRMEKAFLKPAESDAADPVTSVDHSDAAIMADLKITVDEANWLKGHIVADGQIDDIEKALLAFIIDESGPIPVEISVPQKQQRA